VGKYAKGKTMRQIKNQNLEQLLAQLRFAPQQQRLKQLDATTSQMICIFLYPG
jgi:hypothetical protein